MIPAQTAPPPTTGGHTREFMCASRRNPGRKRLEITGRGIRVKRDTFVQSCQKHLIIAHLGENRMFFFRIRNPAAVCRFVLYRCVLHRVRNALGNYDSSAHYG